MTPRNAFTAGQASSGTRAGNPTGTRRELFSFAASGLAGAAMLGLVNKSARASDGVLQATHHPAKAKRVIHICLCGGLSHVDSFDHKPRLAELHGKPLPSSEKPDVFFGQVGLLKKNDWEFKQRGKSGLWISELFPKLAEQTDELTLVRSMFAETSNHTPATFQENSGFRLNGFPVLGSWLSYGLGCETENLPAYVVIPDPRGIPAGGSINWTSGFLPAQHQGVILKSQGPPIADLTPATAVSDGQEAATRKLLTAFNARHHEEHPEDLLSARIRSFELAAKMQLAAPEAADLSKESAETRALYGLEGKESAEFGRACLLARRLLERGVRFVQLYSGGAFGSPRINWDGHEDMVANHSQEAGRIDQPVAGLLADLRRRGMLDDTLVVFTSEFGRTPFSQSKADTVGAGRDHNQYGFATWLAGAGLKHGISYGATDDVGYKAVENPVHWNDFHATVLHLLGIDHERLTFYHNGIQRRLTNVHGHVIKEILA